MPDDLRDNPVLRLALLAAALAVVSGLGGCGVPQWSANHYTPAAMGPLARSGDEGAAADAKAMAAYDAAVALVDAGQYARAEGSFAPLVGQFRQARQADRASKSWFWLAYCLEKRGDAEAAAGEYRKLVAEFPASQAAKLAQGRLDRMGSTPSAPKENGPP